MKSRVSNLKEVALSVLKDVMAVSAARSPDLLDVKYITSRAEHEGDSFFTITLPSFCADFERSLSLGRIEASCFRSFRKRGAIPAFLQGMLSDVFSWETGDLHESPSIEAIRGIRQFCLFAKKIRLACSPERVEEAIRGFAQVERELLGFRPREADVADFISVCASLYGTVFVDFNPLLLVPRHGPGAAADRRTHNSKYVLKEWFASVEPYFPVLGFGYLLSAYDLPEFESIQMHGMETPRVSRLVTVPKTLKAPRTIAIEHSVLQYCQQAIRDYLYDKLESLPLTRGHINFRRQEVNARLALVGSRTGKIATIDLSEASDRVSLDLALRMFDGNVDLREAIASCRSNHTDLPDGTRIGPLAKFGTMGNALCFPVEAMFFYALCVIARLRIHKRPVHHGSSEEEIRENLKNVFWATREIYVYGDDIIVPADEAERVLDCLTKFNCKVNTRKTFWTGKFRESCGTDAFDGHDVTPVYVREPPPRSRADVTALISWVETANHFYWLGMWSTAELMFSHVERILGDLPYLSPDSGGLGRQTCLGRRSAERWNVHLHRPEVRAWVAVPNKHNDPLSGHPALVKCILGLERRKSDTEEPRDEDHLERSVRPGAVTLQRRWVPTY